MKNHFLKGIFNAFLYYLVGAALALLAYIFFKDEYTLDRGARLYHLVMTITWLGGCVWTLYGIYKYMRGQRKPYYMGVVSLNLLVIVAVLIWVYAQSSPTEEAGAPGKGLQPPQALLLRHAPVSFAHDFPGATANYMGIQINLL